MSRKRAMERPESLENIPRLDVTGYWKLLQKKSYKIKKKIFFVLMQPFK